MDSLTEWMDNGPRNDQWHDQRGGLWDGSFQADGLNSPDQPDRHRLNQEPVFADLSVWDPIPDMQDTDIQDTGEDAVVIKPTQDNQDKVTTTRTTRTTRTK